MSKPRKATLIRTTFVTNRAAEFFTESELRMQIGYEKPLWPLVIVKELVDNSLDACESIEAEPKIEITLEPDSISVADNGPGLRESTIRAALNYDQRVSDKKHYVSPTRGQLGNALKCIFPACFVATGKTSAVEIMACGLHHRIEASIDRVAREPRILHRIEKARSVKNGTCVTVHWRDVACFNTDDAHSEFYRGTVERVLRDLIRDFAAVNPQATFTVAVRGRKWTFRASDPNWRKWRTCDPTSAHWYRPEDLRDLIAAHLGEEKRAGTEKRLTVRDFVSDFDGLTGTQYRKRVLHEAGLSDAALADLVTDDAIDMVRVERLLEAMRRNSKPVKPERLGVIGKEHMLGALVAYGAKADSVEYAKDPRISDVDGLPYVVEAAFGVTREGDTRRLIFGLNNSVVFKVPAHHLHGILSSCWVERDDPVVILVNQSGPRFAFTGHGKGSVA